MAGPLDDQGSRSGRRVPRLRALVDPRDARSWHPRLVWWALLDDQYLVEARHSGSHGVLLLAFDLAHLARPLARWHVSLAGSLRLGPDPDEVREWKRLLEAWADARVALRSPTQQLDDFPEGAT